MCIRDSSQCWISNTRAFRIGNVRGWKLAYSDAQSEAAIGFYKLVEGHGGEGMSAVTGSGVINWLQTAEALKPVTASATNWALAPGGYASFQKGQRQCVGFVRDGRSTGGPINWILGAVFCRESNSPIAANEAQFIADTIKVRD